VDRLSLLSLLVGGLLPLLVALVTKASWPQPLKALLLALFSAANGVGTALLNPSGANARTIAANAALTFISAAAVAAGTWKPTGALAKLESIFIRDVVPVLDEIGHDLPPAAVYAGPTSAGTTAAPVVADHVHPVFASDLGAAATTAATPAGMVTHIVIPGQDPAAGDGKQ
jgi:hypothetical protein